MLISDASFVCVNFDVNNDDMQFWEFSEMIQKLISVAKKIFCAAVKINFLLMKIKYTFRVAVRKFKLKDNML